MKALEYYDSVLSEGKNVMFSSPLLHELDIISKEKLHHLFSQIYYFVNNFPGYLGLLLWKANNEKIRFVLTENLIDECGGFQKIKDLDYSETHANLLKRFLMAFEKPLAEKSQHTIQLMESFDHFYIKSTLTETLASMACMEGISSEWFNLIYSQLLQRDEFNSHQLYFFDLHTSLDEIHGDVLKDTLLPMLTDDLTRNLFKIGAMTAATIWAKFYDGISAELDKL